MPDACNGPILIIEDDPDIRETMQQLLDLEGYEVYTAANGQEGVERLGQIKRPCLILLDLMMPVMNGWEFMENVAHTPHSEIPIVVVTAATERKENLRSAAMLKKPVEIETLLQAVHTYCGNERPAC